jgi:hypothetical protein
MANKKINELSSRTPALSDLMIVGDPSSGYSYKATVTALATIIETDISDAFVTLSTTQTISGAKTFSNVITATSVANTPTDPDKFLTLNASNQVTYRTGAEVLSDIGGQGALTLTTTGTSGAATLVGNTLNIPQYTDQYTGTVTSVAASAGTGISISGSPITTSGTLTITNTAPDQVVALTGGTGISISGTYPNFTITNSSPSSGGTVTSVAMSVPTGLTVAGTPITSSGTLAVSLQTGYSIPTTASQTNWDSAYNDKINSASVTGTTTKTLTLTQQDGGTVTASWSDLDSGTITGSGTTNYIPKFTSSSAIGNSQIFDNGTNVGIGTSSPSASYKLSITGNTYQVGTNTKLYLDNGGVGGASIIAGVIGSSYGYLNTDGNFPIAFQINSSEQMRLTSTGLGIGTSNPAYTFHAVSSSSTIGAFRNSGAAIGQLLVGNTVGDLTLRILASGDAFIFADNSKYLAFGSGATEKMRLDASGNLGLGVTPSGSWASDIASKVLEFSGGSVWSYSTSQMNILQNAVFNGSNLLYVNSASASAYRQISGVHSWYTAPSGTAGNAISFTQAMTLDASGSLSIGQTSSALQSGGTGITLYGASASEIKFLNSSTGSAATDGTALVTSGLNFTINNREAGDLLFGTSNTTRLTIASTGAATFSSSVTASGYLSTTDRLYLNGNLAISSYISSSLTAGYSVTNNYGWINGAENLVLGTNGTERMRLTSGGNVGIGTTSPTQLLTVNGAAGYLFTTQENSANNVRFQTYVDGNEVALISGYNTTAKPMTFYIGASERMRITSGGNVGIGTTSPESRLMINGDYADMTGTITYSTNTKGIILNQDGGGGYGMGLWFRQAGLTSGIGSTRVSSGDWATDLRFYTHPSSTTNQNTLYERMRINSEGNVGIGTTSPSARLVVSNSGGTGYEIDPASTSGTVVSLFSYDRSAATWRTTRYSALDHRFEINGTTEAMRITSGGELLINTTSDAGDYKLQVNGNGYFSNTAAGLVINSTNTGAAAYLRLSSSTISDLWFGRENSSGTTFGLAANSSTIYSEGAYPFNLFVNGSTRLTITSSGNTELSGSIKTAAPSGGTAKPWRLGEAGVSVGGANSTAVRVEIDGTTYYLLTAYLP